jgi:NTP pyrophosphatase (non-canonical NTP hydrolase)
MEMNDTELRQAAASTNLLATTIGVWAQGKGFREDWELADKLDAAAYDDKVRGVDQELMAAAASVLRTNIIGTKLMLIVSEIAEALERLRDIGADGVLAGDSNFIEELADGEIRIKELSHMVGQYLGDAEVAKVAKNVDRPHKHGRKM